MIARTLSRIHKFAPHLHYRQKIMFVILLFTLSPILIAGAVAFPLFKNYEMNAMMSSQKEQLKKSVEELEHMDQTNLQKLIFLANSQPLLQMLRDDYRTDLVKYLDNMNEVKGMIGALESDQTRGKIRVYGFRPALYSSEFVIRSDALDRNIVSQIEQTPDNQFDWMLVQDKATGAYTIRLFGKIMDLDQLLAITEISIPVGSAAKLFDYPVSYGGFIMYKHGHQLIALNAANVGSTRLEQAANAYRQGEGGGFRTLAFPLTSNQDEILLFLSRRDMLNHFLLLTVVPLITVAGTLVMIYFSVKAVSFMLTKRLSELLKKTSMNVGKSEPRNDGATETVDEFGILESKFQELVHEIQAHYSSLSESHYQKKLLETELLQVNINPHFLYNTLSAIKWSFPDERLGRLIDSLVLYYRLFLSKGQKTISLRNELEMVRNYIEIQKFSYQSDFTYTIEAPRELLQLSIIKNLIQPVVENAILHGIIGLEGGGRISIKVSKEDALLSVAIEDNGVGMTKEKTARLTEKEDLNAEPEPLQGYGIHNVVQRMALYYGDQAELQVVSSPGGGTRVALRFPVSE